MDQLVITFMGLLSLVDPTKYSAAPKPPTNVTAASVLLLRPDYNPNLALDNHYALLSFDPTSFVSRSDGTKKQVGDPPVFCVPTPCFINISDAVVRLKGKNAPALPTIAGPKMDRLVRHSDVCVNSDPMTFKTALLDWQPGGGKELVARVEVSGNGSFFTVDDDLPKNSNGQVITSTFVRPGGLANWGSCGPPTQASRVLPEQFHCALDLTGNTADIEIQNGTSTLTITLKTSGGGVPITIANSSFVRDPLDCKKQGHTANGDVKVAHAAGYYDLLDEKRDCDDRLIPTGQALPIVSSMGMAHGAPTSKTSSTETVAGKERKKMVKALAPMYGNGAGVHCPPDQLP